MEKKKLVYREPALLALSANETAMLCVTGSGASGGFSPMASTCLTGGTPDFTGGCISGIGDSSSFGESACVNGETVGTGSCIGGSVFVDAGVTGSCFTGNSASGGG